MALALASGETRGHRLEVRAELHFAVSGGKTRLKHSFAEPPLLVQRVLYPDEQFPDLAYLYLLNPTPGLFQGDAQTIVVSAGPKTRVSLTTPSATKIYTMPDREARQAMDITLRDGAYLEYLPEPLIPFRDADLAQRTSVALSSGAIVVSGEVVLPGRLAHGERFAFRSLERRLTVTGPDGNPLLHDAVVLRPQKRIPLGRTVLSPELPVIGNLYILAAGRDIGSLREELGDFLLSRTSNDNSTRSGITTLANQAGLAMRVVAKNGQAASGSLREWAALARRSLLGPNPWSP